MWPSFAICGVSYMLAYDDKLHNDQITKSAIHLLHRAGQCAGDVFLRKVKAAGLTPRQYAILLTVAQNEGLNQTDLVERTGIDRSTLADIIQRMLGKGLLSRERMIKDGRAYAVYITQHGSEVLKMAMPGASDADERLLAALPADQRETFLDTLQMLVSNIDGGRMIY